MAAQNTKRALKVDDLFAINKIAEPQISPDEKWVAYTITSSDLTKDKSETRVWMSPAKGGDALPMTAKGYSASEPRFSPDGKYLSFIAKRSESGDDKKDSEDKPQVWALNRLGGEAQQLTSVKQGVSGYEWSPDGKQLLLLIKDPQPFELTEDKEDDKKPRPHVIDRLQFKLDYEGYLDRYRSHLYVYTPHSDIAPRQITSGDFDDSQPAWSPDGKSIAFVSNRTNEPDSNANTDIWIVSADNTDKGATLFQLTTNPREDDSPVWSPDGKSIAYSTITASQKLMWYATNELALVSAKGGEASLLTPELDRNIIQPTFSADGRQVFFVLEDSGEQNLASVSVKGGSIKQHVKGEMEIEAYAMHGKTTVVLSSKREQMAELYTVDSAKLVPLTTTNQALMAQLNLATTENIHYKSADGTEIEAFVTKPLGFNPAMQYPLILHPHGGPVAQYSFAFNFQAQLLAANGYVVLQPNPRGSSGYGQDFSQAIFADWGNLDFQDVMAGVDYLVAQGYVDADKLGVGGWSYGGILTNYVITKSTRFKAAISGASEALMRSNYGHDQYQQGWEIELGLPWENAAAWEKISSFNDVAKITTPTLWMGGGSDWNVPILNSEQMYQAMKRLGRQTQLVVYPGEFHGINRPTFQKDRFERYLSWYNQYIKGIAPDSTLH
ncbi:peptidase S9 [Paraglaciecola hydrolytica]|uniref:Peptidase S9 n=1 Tax=Paraglaciecola hydrolytica TaxID=1799789 RepID=A0A148KMG0_9ALTE|nr:peptidase S9 [Paraglaciecola hydrolytica]